MNPEKKVGYCLCATVPRGVLQSKTRGFWRESACSALSVHREARYSSRYVNCNYKVYDISFPRDFVDKDQNLSASGLPLQQPVYLLCR